MDVTKDEDGLNGSFSATAAYATGPDRWVLFSNENYNNDIAGGNASNIRVLDKTMGQVEFKFHSVRRIPGSVVVLDLFEHYYYGGRKEELSQSSAALPADVKYSSAIVGTVGAWQLYMNTGFSGANSVLTPGDYPGPGDMKLPNDSVKSAKYIGG